nr:IQ domain-containing protein K isoform X3 [Peromyscus maniculatus bairdii]
METACMAVARQVSNRGVLREEAGGSADSSVTARTPVPPVSPGSLERLVSPAQVTESPGKNLWEQICEEYEAEIPTLPEGYKVKEEAAVTVSSVTPLEELVPHGFNTEHYFPVHSFPVVPPVPCPPKKTETVEPKTCSPKDYLEMFIFPVLLPGMANLLHQAKREKCFEAVFQFLYKSCWLRSKDSKQIISSDSGNAVFSSLTATIKLPLQTPSSNLLLSDHQLHSNAISFLVDYETKLDAYKGRRKKKSDGNVS